MKTFLLTRTPPRPLGRFAVCLAPLGCAMMVFGMLAPIVSASDPINGVGSPEGTKGFSSNGVPTIIIAGRVCVDPDKVVPCPMKGLPADAQKEMGWNKLTDSERAAWEWWIGYMQDEQKLIDSHDPRGK